MAAQASRLTFNTPDGLTLAADSFGPDNGYPVLFAHGGGQTRHAWQNTCIAFAAQNYRAVAIDLRGHGASDWAPNGDYRLERFAADLTLVADSFNKPPALVGASLGGMAGLIAQGEKAPTDARGFSAIVLVDIATRMRMDGVEKIIGFMSENLNSGFTSLEDAADAVARYLPNRPRPKDLSGLQKNLRLKEDGRYYWHWDPRFITGDNRPEGSRSPDRLEMAGRNLSIPTLLIRGKQSELIDMDSVRAFQEHVPHAEFVDVAHAGHMVAGDRNDVFSDAVMTFLSSQREAVPMPTDG
ncbi:hypothetical protein CYMTET_5850 [Cymbomonas tetramitiformis]|uniref:AB hydrolase-1 domain-containing protein n=1 Tax=Cymbomonas tetramitiformis TaxID=36881 RepID=A0AAE0LJ34_9CHLO|nr:hypothetical protein CYMTET_5850 [Cymbomonas tetramitiformis]MCE8000570.1 alpha/beta hydrolase [Rhodobiaceae bacterium]